jgi:hypothetical protein
MVLLLHYRNGLIESISNRINLTSLSDDPYFLFKDDLLNKLQVVDETIENLKRLAQDQQHQSSSPPYINKQGLGVSASVRVRECLAFIKLQIIKSSNKFLWESCVCVFCKLRPTLLF